MRTLTQRELNRALLARQLLLERGRMPLPEALERIGGIQAQYAPSMYVGLWSRLEGFERDALTRALERRSVVQATLMRSTIHLVSRADYWPFALAIREARRDAAGCARVRDAPAPRAMAGRRARCAAALTDGSMTRKEIEALLGRPRAQRDRAVGRPRARAAVGHVGAPPRRPVRGRRGLDRPAAGRRQTPPSTSSAATWPASGPASRKDVASFTGLALQRGRPPCSTGSSCARFGGRRCSTSRARRCRTPTTPAPVRFLPTWDATLLVHARRARMLPEEHRPRIFSIKTPHSFPTFLVDGAVAGTWRYERRRIGSSRSAGSTPRTGAR